MTGDAPGSARDSADRRLPPVTVNCPGCGAQFLSRARHQMPVHCPRCGRSVRVRRLQPQAALPAEQRDWDDDGDETYIRDASGRLVLAEWTGDGYLVPAATASPPAAAPGRPIVPGRPAAAGAELTVDDALGLCGWRLAPTAGGCQIVDAGKLCRADARWQIESCYLANVWICTHHYYALCKVITKARRRK